MTNALSRSLWLMAIAALLSACGGIPLSSMPRLLKLPGQLIDADPAEFLFALQTDARLVPASDAVPTLNLAIKPKQLGDYEAVDDHLPMHFDVAAGATLGLAPPDAGRRWLIYRLTPASQAELRRVQAAFRQRRAQKNGPQGGTLTLGIAQEGIAVDDPAYANTRWESWLQTSRRDGFYKLWSGTAVDLMRKKPAR